MGWQEDLRAKRAATERWIRQRALEVDRSAHDLEARGHKIYADTIRTGQQVLARTPTEVRQLALAAATGRLPQEAARVVVKAAAPTLKRVVSEAATPAGRVRLVEAIKEEGRAGLSGAVDEASFGLADKALSGTEALLNGGFSGFESRYAANEQRRTAEDLRDEREHATARNVGRAAGFAADLAIGGAPGLTRGVLSLVPRGAKLYDALTTSRHLLDPRGLNAMAAGGGALGGVIGQVIDDAGNQRLSSLRDYASATIGGGAGGLATLHGGVVRGGGVEGATTAMVGDVLNGRGVDVDGALDGAKRGAVVGGLAGAGGSLFAHALPALQTGHFGELLSSIKTIARGDGVPTRTGKRFYLDNGRYTYPDLEFRTSRPGKRTGIGEAKMGPTVTLSDRQLEAQAQNDIDYVVDGWRYSDAGKAFSGAFTPTADRILQYDPERARLR